MDQISYHSSTGFFIKLSLHSLWCTGHRFYYYRCHYTTTNKTRRQLLLKPANSSTICFCFSLCSSFSSRVIQLVISSEVWKRNTADFCKSAEEYKRRGESFKYLMDQQRNRSRWIYLMRVSRSSDSDRIELHTVL